MKDERTRFNLAVECGNIEVALQSAQVCCNQLMQAHQLMSRLFYGAMPSAGVPVMTSPS